MRSKTVGLSVVASLLALGGCNDPGTTRVELERAIMLERGIMLESLSKSMVPAGVMRHDLDQITREIALGLADPAVRQMLFEALHASPYPEHKLHFGTFLRQRGAILGAAMATARGQAATVADVLATLDGIIDLEFYMPVKDHFAKWDGGSDLIVATSLQDRDIPVAFDLEGNPVSLLSAEVAPSTPTIGLVPVETDFTKVRRSPDFGATQAVMIEPAGVYMTYAYISDDHEGFLRGNPEFETYLWGKTTTTFSPKTCAGEHASDPAKQYDHNDLSWVGRVQIATEDEIAPFITSDSTVRMFMDVWEDDNISCVIRTDIDVPNILGNLASAAFFALVATSGENAGEVVLFATISLGFLVSGILDIGSRDDYVGIAVPKCGTTEEFFSGEWVIIDGNDGNVEGSLTIDNTMDGGGPAVVCYPDPPNVQIAGPSEVPPSELCVWEANVSNGEPPFTITWSGVLTGSGDWIEGSLTSSGTLTAWVTDAIGRTDGDNFEIEVTGGGEECEA